MTQTIDPRIVEQFNNRAPFSLDSATLIVLARIGSESHNTYVPKDTPNSIDDIDYMGVILPPIEFILGLKNWDGLNFQFEELDCVFYSLKHFVSLLAKSNPNVLGMLWLEDRHYVYKSNEFNLLISNRKKFSSKNMYHAFIGYAHGQLHKMTSFDAHTMLEEDRVLRIIERCGWTREQVVSLGHLDMPKDPLVSKDSIDEAIKTLRAIHAKHYQGYMGEKRKNLVRKHGYDTKNAAHLIRLLRMLNEFMATGHMQVFRITDANELRDIKSGKWTLDEVKVEADSLFEEAKEIKDRSELPETVDMEAINSLLVDITKWGFSIGG